MSEYLQAQFSFVPLRAKPCRAIQSDFAAQKRLSRYFDLLRRFLKAFEKVMHCDQN